jgi:hypothetical protein
MPRAKQSEKNKSRNGVNRGIEAQLWQTPNDLRDNTMRALDIPG